MAPVMSLALPKMRSMTLMWTIPSGRRSSTSPAFESTGTLVVSPETTAAPNFTMPPHPLTQCSVEESPMPYRVPIQPDTAHPMRPARDSPCTSHPMRPGIQAITIHAQMVLSLSWPYIHARQRSNAPKTAANCVLVTVTRPSLAGARTPCAINAHNMAT